MVTTHVLACVCGCRVAASSTSKAQAPTPPTPPPAPRMSPSHLRRRLLDRRGRRSVGALQEGPALGTNLLGLLSSSLHRGERGTCATRGGRDGHGHARGGGGSSSGSGKDREATLQTPRQRKRKRKQNRKRPTHRRGLVQMRLLRLLARRGRRAARQRGQGGQALGEHLGHLWRGRGVWGEKTG